MCISADLDSLNCLYLIRVNKTQQQNMYVDFVRRMPSGDEYNGQVKTVAAKNTTMHAVNHFIKMMPLMKVWMIRILQIM